MTVFGSYSGAVMREHRHRNHPECIRDRWRMADITWPTISLLKATPSNKHATGAKEILTSLRRQEI
jgi:hypothetical protein